MDINVALVEELIATQFPEWASLVIIPVELNGWDNRTFHLGDSMSVRLPSAERYTAQVEKEHQWLPRLAPFLPLPIPSPIAMGVPSDRYPWHWSIYRWLEGENATIQGINNLQAFATKLGQFLVALQAIDPTEGPEPGLHNFYRGGSLAIYSAETYDAIAMLDGAIDTTAAIAIWESALEATWQQQPVWVHGDVSASNLLVRNGKLRAVIDFGCLGVGDPACDLAIAWTLLSGRSREAFREVLSVDDGTWVRGRGWALWKSLITLAEHRKRNASKAQQAQKTIHEILGDCGN